MPLDILIFAIIAAALAYRLYTVLGTRGEDAPAFGAPPAVLPTPVQKQVVVSPNVAATAVDGVADIAAADPSFDAEGFLQGARAAFETIVSAYARGDRETLRPLVSPKLFVEFDTGIATRDEGAAPAAAGRVTAARIIEAHLGGAMAYVTVDFDVDPSEVRDIWTFTRDTRADDPNWLLIETRTAGG